MISAGPFRTMTIWLKSNAFERSFVTTLQLSFIVLQPSRP